MRQTPLPPVEEPTHPAATRPRHDEVTHSATVWADYEAIKQLPPVHAHQIDRRTSKLIAAFGHAFRGLWYFLRTQRNAQIHCLISACAIALALVLQIERWEWLALVLIIALVLAAEGVNTAIEAVVDLVTSSYHPLARIAKDVAAGTVLLCAMLAVLVGCLIFLPHLWDIWLYWGADTKPMSR